ncbi:MAG TPA: hypothetical protein ENN84_06010 [Candidatus Marinimicrobia bacterium]|nr:hypothetical protein [Candidatus Neomarinimicrobiota bacterium]
MFRFAISSGGDAERLTVVEAQGYKLDESTREAMLRELALRKNYLDEAQLPDDPDYAELEDFRIYSCPLKAADLPAAINILRSNLPIRPDKIWLDNKEYDITAIEEYWTEE